jgi:hypothetical protein
MARGGVCGRIGPAGTPEWEITGGGSGFTDSDIGAFSAGLGLVALVNSSSVVLQV